MTTPTCPGCGAKFPGREECQACGMPQGLKAADVHRWKVGQLMEKGGISEKAAKRQLTRNRRKHNKHGRKGVKRAT